MTDPITAAYNFINIHPFFALMMVGAYIAGVGQLPSPTKDSPAWYPPVFAVLNFFSLQFGRMVPKVENSPNWKDAVDKHCASNNGGKTDAGIAGK